MTELEQHLIKALEQMRQEHKQEQTALRQMFESTKEHNQILKQSLVKFSERQTEMEKTRRDHLNSLTEQVNSLTKQLQQLEMQLR
ncbi:MbeD/MobD family mobilization/exclusion protein, partial [Bacillus cereus]|uniref:MbeD/MobD family mobilization/exclusion protein n=1 Tax=Bacillus cereus TaxID=1396 RepID=UPI0034D46059